MQEKDSNSWCGKRTVWYDYCKSTKRIEDEKETMNVNITVVGDENKGISLTETK